MPRRRTALSRALPLALAVALALLLPTAAGAQTLKLRILETTDVHMNLVDTELDAPSRNMVFHLVQESLKNVEHHAAALP